MACIEVKVGGLRARRSRPVPGVMARSGVVCRVRTRKSNMPKCQWTAGTQMQGDKTGGCQSWHAVPGSGRRGSSWVEDEKGGAGDPRQPWVERGAQEDP